MDKMTTGMLIVEGQTEQIFVEKLLGPYLAVQNIFISAKLASKKGQGGGDIKFERISNDLRIHLNQQHNDFPNHNAICS